MLIDSSENAGVTYELYDDDTLVVSGEGYADWRDNRIIVTDEGEYLSTEKDWKNQIKKVIGQEGIIEMTFPECENLTEVVIPGSVQVIREGNFSDCPNLTKVSVGEGVMRIDTGAFSNCPRLAEIELPDTLVEVGFDAFEGTALFENIDGVVYAGSIAYSNTTDIQSSITFREGTRVIAEYAFDNLDNITSVTIPDGAISIGAYAFKGCKNLSEINVPDSVFSIGAEAFHDTKWLHDYKADDTQIYYAGKVAYYNNLYVNGMFDTLGDLVLKEDTIGIADQAFTNCYYDTATLPAGLKWIGNADIRLKKQEELTIPDGVTHIGNDAIEGLSRVIIPASVTSIANNAFCYPPDEFTIIAPKGSYAESYALDNGYQFEAR